MNTLLKQVLICISSLTGPIFHHLNLIAGCEPTVSSAPTLVLTCRAMKFTNEDLYKAPQRICR